MRSLQDRLAPRRVGKADLSLTRMTGRGRGYAGGARSSDWASINWHSALMVASYAETSRIRRTFDAFCSTAEINELIALAGDCRSIRPPNGWNRERGGVRSA